MSGKILTVAILEKFYLVILQVFKVTALFYRLFKAFTATNIALLIFQWKVCIIRDIYVIASMKKSYWFVNEYFWNSYTVQK